MIATSAVAASRRSATSVAGVVVETLALATMSQPLSVIRVETGSRRVVRCVGLEIGELADGMHVELDGHWEVDERYGRQFRIRRVRSTLLPNEVEGISAYLGAVVPGIGRRRAATLVKVLGVEALGKLRAAESDALVRQIFPGSTGLQVVAGLESWRRAERAAAASARLTEHLLRAGVTPRLARRIVGYFHEAEAAEVAALRHPYRLLDVPGLGWTRADAVARLLGVDPAAPERLLGAARWALAEARRHGHSGAPARWIGQRIGVHTGGAAPPVAVRAALHRLREDGHAVERGGVLLDPSTAVEEWRLAVVASRLLAEPTILTEEHVQIVRDAIGAGRLNDTQADAVWAAVRHRLAVLTGRPGAGKTTTLRVLLDVYRKIGLEVRLVAPTGKAASRAQEVTGVPACTIHRLLSEGRVSADAVVIDEASMCDLELAARLLGALDPARTRVLVVGDADQLPSVGHGQVLADLIASGRVPVTRLTQVYRQGEGSRLLANAHALLDGAPLDLAEGGDWRCVLLDDAVLPGDMARTVGAEWRALSAAFDLATEVQILAPMKRGVCGVDRLSPRVQAALTAGSREGPAVAGGSRARVGDRLVMTRNGYDLEVPVFNGEQGTVTDVSGSSLTMQVDAERSVTLRGAQCLFVRLAWAMTVHRSQGSEYPAVILAYHHVAHAPMMDLGVLYTAMTRARRRFVLLTTPSALAMTAAKHARRQRWTGLATCLRELMGA